MRFLIRNEITNSNINLQIQFPYVIQSIRDLQ